MINYKKLEAWKKPMNLVKEVYLIVKTYTNEELFALTSQTKRAAVSIPANIAVMVEIIKEKDFEPFANVIDENIKIPKRLNKLF